MKKLYAIKDDSANQVVSMYFVAESEIEAIRQFKGFISQGNYPAFPKELSLYETALIKTDGSLFFDVDSVESFSTSLGSYYLFSPFVLCRGDEIEEKYINYSRVTKEDFDKLKVTKNITEAEFDEEQKNGDFGK